MSRDTQAFCFAFATIALLALILKGCGSVSCSQNAYLPGQCLSGSHWEVH